MSLLRPDQLASLVVADLRSGVRQIKRAPLTACTMILTLAVGIAVVTAVLSYANAVYFSPLPFKDAERIIAIGEEATGYHSGFSSVRGSTVKELLRPSRAFERISVYSEGLSTFVSGTDARRQTTLRIDTSFIGLFAIRPQLGRSFTNEEILGSAAVALISDQFWRTAFGGDTAIIDTRLQLGDRRYRVIGVMPRRFRFPWHTDIWLPLSPRDLDRDSTDSMFGVLAKLRPRADMAMARTELLATSARMQGGTRRLPRAELVPRAEMMDRRARQFAPMPSLFIGGALLILAVACSNVSTLALGQTARRRSELAVRRVLGASRRRIALQLITESALIAFVGAAIGALLSLICMRLALAIIPTGAMPSWISVDFNLRALAVCVALAVLVAVVVGSSSTGSVTHSHLANGLKTGGGSHVSSRWIGRRSRQALAVQLSAALILSVGSVLLFRSYLRLSSIDLGFPADRIARVSLYLDESFSAERQFQFAENLALTVQSSMPAVESAVLADYAGERQIRAGQVRSQVALASSALLVDGHPLQPEAFGLGVQPRFLAVSRPFFAITGQRLIAGRVFGEEDGLSTMPIVVVSQTFAHATWQRANPIGHTVQLGTSGKPHLVVGVVADVRGLRRGSRGLVLEPQADVYFLADQASGRNFAVLARGEATVEGLRSAILARAHAREPSIVFDPNEKSMASRSELPRSELRIFGSLLGMFAVTTVFLACLGLYAVIARGVTDRTREFGVRVALGSSPGRLVVTVLEDGLRAAGSGLAIGLLLAVGASQFLRALLFGVPSVDVTTYAIVILGFVLLAMIASIFPALMAARVEPASALRAE